MNPIWSGPKARQRLGLVGALCLSVTLSMSQESRTVQTASDKTEPPHNSLTVRISPRGTIFHPGHILKLHVELRNTGYETIFVPKEIELSGCAKGSLQIFSLKGAAFPGPGVGCARDCFPTPDDSKRPPIASVVMGDWVPLPPGYAYSRDIESYPLGKAGRYLIGGDYRSLGLGGSCGWNYPEEEIAKLAYPLWTGQVDTNSIWIEVTKP
jgi:hypothetical protein